MIDLEAKHLATVRGILLRHAPGLPVYVFGSRAKGRAKRFSDLDLAVVTDQPMDGSALARLHEAFDDSDLPIMVDLVDWNRSTPEFRMLAGPLTPLDA